MRGGPGSGTASQTDEAALRDTGAAAGGQDAVCTAGATPVVSGVIEGCRDCSIAGSGAAGWAAIDVGGSSTLIVGGMT